ncbi:MAG: hypothetical protein ACKVPX_05450 [Myxococcaceae bacterium]
MGAAGQWEVALYVSVFVFLGCATASQRPAALAVTKAQQEVVCGRSFEGEWVHSEDASYRYRATDDGQRLRLSVYRVGADGTETPTSNAPEIVLERSAAGLVGESRAPVFGPGGQACVASFETRATVCTADELSLLSTERVWVDASCKTAPRKEAVREQTLRRR